MIGLAASARPTLVQTPLLGRMVEAIKEENRMVVIDLGTISPSLLALLQPYRARLDGLACHEQLESWSSTETSAEAASLIHAHLKRYALEKADWLLCWGFLNYFDAPMMGVFASAIKPYLKPSARIHALIEYSSPTMPEKPASLDLSFHEGKPFLDISPPGKTIPSPRYTPKRLESMLHGLRAENAILLSNGMQEYVFSPVMS